MPRKEVTARAERITKLLPKIMSSIARWHSDRMTMSIGEDGRMRSAIGDLKMSASKGVKLTFNQYQVLTVINTLGSCSVNELAAKLRLAQSTTSQLVDRLVRAGFVNRETSQADRRRIEVTLSKTGTRMMERRRESLLHAYEGILSSLDEEDQKMLEDAFNKFALVAAKLNQTRPPRQG